MHLLCDTRVFWGRAATEEQQMKSVNRNLNLQFFMHLKEKMIYGTLIFFTCFSSTKSLRSVSAVITD